MVYEAPDHMPGPKKMSLRMGIKSPFGRKSNKKTAKLTATENLFVGEDSVVSPVLEPEVDAKECQRKGIININSQPEMSTKFHTTTAKGSSGKSHKWLFRNRRSEDNGRVEETNLNPNLSNDQDNDVEPGSTVENNDSHGTATDQRHVGSAGAGAGEGDGDARVWGNQGIHPPVETSTKHQFHKVTGYVVPLRRQEDKPLSKNLQDICPNGFLDGDTFQEMKDQCDADTSSRDLNGNPACSSTLTDNHQVIPNETNALPQVKTDQLRPPEIPARLKDKNSEPELPPRIPPKPASLRYRTVCSDMSSSVNGIGEGDDDELPPRPPARPKNRTLMKASIKPWNYWDNSNNRATVYETISLEPKEASLAKELAKLPRQPWYWGPLTQAQAEEKLAKLPDGNFLVRDSSDDRYLLSLSFNSHGRTLHTRIEHRNGLFSLNDSDGHTSVVELIVCAVKESRNGVYGYMRDALGVQSFPARLTNWVSRFTEMRSLQHLCRFLIREVYPRHHIQMLPLPKKIKEYILENQY